MGRACYKPNCYSRSSQGRNSPVALWFPFARDLLWRETEVVSQATKRIWSAGLAKYTNENVAALIPKGGE